MGKTEKKAKSDRPAKVKTEIIEKEVLVPEPEQVRSLSISALKNISEAVKLANNFKEVIEKQKLSQDIGGKPYVVVEGWNTLGAMMGVFPEVIETIEFPIRMRSICYVKQVKWDKFKKQNYDVFKFVPKSLVDPVKMEVKEEREAEEIRWKVIVLLKDMQGNQICKADAICSNMEEGKLSNDEYMILSMAQTRATGKAFRLAFSWLVRLAGFEPTFAEDIGTDIDDEAKIKESQIKKIKELQNKIGVTDDELAKFTLDRFKVPMMELTISQADALCEGLTKRSASDWLAELDKIIHEGKIEGETAEQTLSRLSGTQVTENPNTSVKAKNLVAIIRHRSAQNKNK